MGRLVHNPREKDQREPIKSGGKIVRILVVEDDPGLNKLAQKRLRDAGFETEGVLTGAEALDRINSDPDLIALVDQQLPDMKGTELITTLITQNLAIPFVAMTGSGDEHIAIEMMKLGARDYLIKSLGFIDLLPGVFQHLNRELETEVRLASAEKALQQSEERFQLAMEATQDGLWDWDVETNSVYLSHNWHNPNWSSLLGYTSDEFLLNFDRWNNFIHPDDKASVDSAYSDCIKSHNDDFEVEYRMRIGKGDWIWILGRGKVVSRNGNGHAMRMVGTQTDITKLKQSEAELTTQAATLNLIFNSTPNTLILVDEQLQIEKINHSGIVFSGRKEEELIGHLIGDVINCFHSYHGKGCGRNPECALCPIRARVNATFETGLPYHEDECGKFFLIDNKKTLQSLIVSTVLVTVGKSNKVLVTVTNVSNLKQVEMECSALEKQLHQSQKMQSIGSLAGGIAHDFNNILTAILGYTQMAIYANKQDSNCNEDLAEVIKAGNRAKDLVQQILAFSHESDTKCISVQPERIVKEVVKMLRPSLPSTILINEDCQSTGSILANPTQLHQVVMNICTNAYHAMEKTGGQLDITLKETHLSKEDVLCTNHINGGGFAQLSIRDTGHGMDKETRDKIFDPYFTTKETGKGTGMGLSIVHGIVASYGGVISLISEPGKGTTFNIYLPIINQQPLPATYETKQTLTGKERILIVDDEETIVYMNKKVLEKLGYQVTTSTSSLGGLEIFQNQPNQFDLVITDQTMPNMTGVDLARNILQIRHDIPIILCTGYSTIVTEESAKSIGIKEFIMKPMEKDVLAQSVRKVLDDEFIPCV